MLHFITLTYFSSKKMVDIYFLDMNMKVLLCRMTSIHHLLKTQEQLFLIFGNDEMKWRVK